LVTPTTAIEVEWTTKPYEAIGQALHYSQELNLHPGIVFLISPDKPPKSYVLNRVKKVSKKYGIDIWWFDTQTSELKKESE